MTSEQTSPTNNPESTEFGDAMQDMLASKGGAEVSSGGVEAQKVNRQLEESRGFQALIDRALMSYERLPMLEIVFDRLGRLLSTSLRNLTAENVDVDIKGIFSLRFGDYMQSVPMPTLLGIFKVIEWENFGLVVPNVEFIFSMVDLLFGGRKHTMARVANRPFTMIEQAVVRQLMNIILNDLAGAFEPISPANFQLDRMENNPRFVTICRPGDAAILVELSINMEGRGGKVEVLLPYETLEPIRELLAQVYMGEKFGKDPAWEGHLEKEMLSARLDLKAVLDEKEISLHEVMQWQVGDTVILDVLPEEDIKLKCADIEMISGVVGSVNENVAIKVTHTIPKKIEEVLK